MRRLVLSAVPILFALAACRQVLGIEDVRLDNGHPTPGMNPDTGDGGTLDDPDANPGPTDPTNLFTDGGGPHTMQLALAGMLACALRPEGTVFCWGSNANGEAGVGLGDGRPVPAPTRVEITDAVSVAVGGTHACVASADGSVRCWGSNQFGELGIGMTGGPSLLKPDTPVQFMNDAIAVAAGANFTCALHRTKSVSCWGSNEASQIGNGNTASAPEPTPANVNTKEPFVQIVAGDRHACGLRENGMVMCWGTNVVGQLGTDGVGSSSVPLPVGGSTNPLSSVARLAAGANHTCALLTTGGVACWGSNSDGQLGSTIATKTFTANPLPIAGLEDATSIGAGGQHTCAVRKNGGIVVCWGRASDGELGTGLTPDADVTVDSPAMVTGLQAAVGVAAGGGFSCAVTSGAGVLCGGNNDAGELGDGTIQGRGTPALTLPF
jgi:alpha-tubulin suppressor-like RCC1 family protein